MTLPVDEIVSLIEEIRRGLRAHAEELAAPAKKDDETLVMRRPAVSVGGLISKILSGEFEERLSAVERRVSYLESKK